METFLGTLLETSSKTTNIRHVRLAEFSRPFSIYLDHPSYQDLVKVPKNSVVTLVVNKRVIRDFYHQKDKSYKLRLFLMEFGVLKGSLCDRKNLDILHAKLTSAFKSRDLVEILRDYPYYAMSVPRENRLYGFDVADSMCNVLGHSIQKMCRGHCHYMIKDFCDDEGHTCLPYDTYKFRINGFPGALVKQQIDILIRHGSLVCHNNHVFTSETFRRESSIKMFLQYPHAFFPLEPNDLLIPDLSEQQAEVLDLVSERRIALLCGGAGTGKTRCIAAVTCAFKNVILAAPTGKAARRIVQSCRDFNPYVKASTIHSLLGIGASADVKKKSLDKIERNALLVIDESSMLDLDVMFHVVATAKDLNMALLFVGDPNQLPPVSRGDVFANMIDWARENDSIVELTEIHRQAESNPIYKMGYHICSGLPSENVLDYVDDKHLQFYEVASLGDAVEKAISLRDLHSSNVFDCQIITPWKRVADAVNKIVIGSDRRLVSFRPGDYVMCRTNVSDSDFSDFQTKEVVAFPRPRDKFTVDHVYKSRKMFDVNKDGNMSTDAIQGFQRGVNGHCGILLNSNVLVDDNSDFVYIGNEKSHASAITVHKSQGSEWPTVILIMNNSSNTFSPFLNRKLLYTALTRAKKRLIVIGNPEAVKWGVERFPSKRHTMPYI